MNLSIQLTQLEGLQGFRWQQFLIWGGQGGVSTFFTAVPYQTDASERRFKSPAGALTYRLCHGGKSGESVCQKALAMKAATKDRVNA